MDTPFTNRLLIALLAISLAITLSACAEEPPPGEEGGASIGETQPPGEFPGQPENGMTTGSVGEPIVVGDWTVLVREVETEGPERRGEPGSSEEERQDPGILTFTIDMSHDQESALPLVRDDWALESAEGGSYKPVEANEDLAGEDPSVDAAETATISLVFEVADPQGAFMLRFEPSEGGPGVARIAIP
jgi:hypothetical protein